MKERLMENMTVKDVIEALKKTKTVLLPIGGTEQHGWHLPLSTDAIYGYSLAKAASRITGCMVAPILNYSHSYGTLAGTTNISPDTLKRVIVDICFSLIEQGFESIIVALGHGEPSSIYAAEDAVSLLQKEKVAKVVLFADFSASLRVTEMIGDEEDGHAGKGETSIIMYLKPELVRREKPFDPQERWWIKTVAKIHQAGKWWQDKKMRLDRVPLEEVEKKIKEAEQKYFPVKYGIFGNPTRAKEEIGEAYIEDKVKVLVSLIEELEQKPSGDTMGKKQGNP